MIASWTAINCVEFAVTTSSWAAGLTKCLRTIFRPVPLYKPSPPLYKATAAVATFDYLSSLSSALCRNVLLISNTELFF